MQVLDVLYSPWAIVPDRLLEIQAIYAAHLRGEKIDIAALEARAGRPLKNEGSGYVVDDGVALIPMRGVIAQRMNLFSDISGGTSSELLARDVRAALADSEVQAIMLMVDSPGGAVSGTQAAAAAVLAARGQKPIGAFVDGMMASAAYWIGSAVDAGSVWVDSNTAQIGSIGVVATHTDVSKREEMLGIKTTEIVAGKYKRIASEYGPLTESGRATIQEQVDHIYSVFVADVAQHRGVSVERVLASMADGRVFMGQQAVDAGLVDAVASRDTAITELKSRAAMSAQKPFVPKKPTRGSFMTPQETAATFATENKEAAEVLRAQGAANERDRIAAVRALSLSGHEALIEQLAGDGKTTAEQAAVQLIGAVKAENARIATARANDAPAPVRIADPDQGDNGNVNVVAITPGGRRISSASAELHAKAQSYMSGHPGTDYISAVKAVQLQGSN